MTLRAAVLLAAFAVLFGFIGLNWTEFFTPSMLSFGFTSVQMPVGFVMLGALVAVVALFSAYIVYLQRSWAHSSVGFSMSWSRNEKSQIRPKRLVLPM